MRYAGYHYFQRLLDHLQDQDKHTIQNQHTQQEAQVSNTVEPTIYQLLRERYGQKNLDTSDLCEGDFSSGDGENIASPQAIDLTLLTPKQVFLMAGLTLKIKVFLTKITAHHRRLFDIYDWSKKARPNQREPRGRWRVWLILAGRGFGKTRTGAETIRKWVEERRYRRIALVGASASEVRDVMIEGNSGLLSVFPHTQRPVFHPSKRRIEFHNGAIATVFSAENPEQLRGPQFDCAWIDEYAKFRDAQQIWDQLNLALRLGSHPKVIITTTPRDVAPLKHLIEHEPQVKITRGSTHDNKKNLSKNFLSYIQKKYQNTLLGRQEVDGQLITQSPDRPFSIPLLEQTQCYQKPEELDLKRLVIAIDPAVSAKVSSDETGIIVAGTDYTKAYVLDDMSGKYRPSAWAKKAIDAFHKYRANAIVVEVNQGGDLVREVIHAVDARVPIISVHATRGKYLRLEPVLSLYEQGRIRHLNRQRLKDLEIQMLNYDPNNASSGSPDRMDALVWAITDLLLSQPKPRSLKILS